jgi:hypothetical protein
VPKVHNKPIKRPRKGSNKESKKGKRREKKRYHKKRGGDAHMCHEWDSDESSTDSSSDEDVKGSRCPRGGGVNWAFLKINTN